MNGGGQVYEGTTVPAEQPPGKGSLWGGGGGGGGGCTIARLGPWRLLLKAAQMLVLIGIKKLDQTNMLGKEEEAEQEKENKFQKGAKKRAGATIFGYFASITFLVDFGVMFRKKRKAKEERKPENTANTINATENQPLNNQSA
ncbi:hypothetical protein JD844_002839 [Phrynosoma platyrhinos]|uniref:Uncharacterized protein n=1 Tax=Phrynosoma platyrhinos TaxID=52577 RepID=A0ABQ7TCE1_PHRPL|nr:hypothetical protein JD844_002839 [Phrynosoma platyrhinos]